MKRGLLKVPRLPLTLLNDPSSRLSPVLPCRCARTYAQIVFITFYGERQMPCLYTGMIMSQKFAPRFLIVFGTMEDSSAFSAELPTIPHSKSGVFQELTAADSAGNI